MSYNVMYIQVHVPERESTPQPSESTSEQPDTKSGSTESGFTSTPQPSGSASNLHETGTESVELDSDAENGTYVLDSDPDDNLANILSALQDSDTDHNSNMSSLEVDPDSSPLIVAQRRSTDAKPDKQVALATDVLIEKGADAEAKIEGDADSSPDAANVSIFVNCEAFFITNTCSNNLIQRKTVIALLVLCSILF